MTSWQIYAHAMDEALACEVAAARAATRNDAVEAAEAALIEGTRALDLATTPAGERFARARCERLAADLVTYQERAPGTWPPAPDPDSGARFKVALNAGLDRSLEAMKPESREEVAELYGRSAERLAEAAVAAGGGPGEEAARRSHRYAAGQIERVADPKEWPMRSEIKAMLQKLDREDREERQGRGERGISR